MGKITNSYPRFPYSYPSQLNGLNKWLLDQFNCYFVNICPETPANYEAIQADCQKILRSMDIRLSRGDGDEALKWGIKKLRHIDAKYDVGYFFKRKF